MKRAGLKNLRKLWAGKKLLMLASIFSAGLMAGFTPQSFSQPVAQPMRPDALPSYSQSMTYELYAGGFNAVQAKLDVAYKAEDRYRLELFAATKGFLGKLVPWQGMFETHGWRLPEGKEIPELHKSTAVWDGEKDIKEYKYGRDGSFESLRITEAGKDKTPESLDEELVQGTTDALTATLQAMKTVARQGTCEGGDEVFDGKRRFKLVFRHKGEEEMRATRYNVYHGPAVRCEVEVMPVSGAWHKKPRGWVSIQEQGRDKGSLPTVWLAKVSDQGPAVPVKLRVKTNYGTLFMHMIEYKNSDKDLKTLAGH